MPHHRPLAATLVAALLVTLAVPATSLAADDSDAGADSSTTQTSSDYTDKQLKQFVKAQNGVQAAMQKYDDQIAQADGDKKNALQTKENKALVKAVKSSGLDPDTYNAIAKSAQDDPALTKRIQSFMTPR